MYFRLLNGFHSTDRDTTAGESPNTVSLARLAAEKKPEANGDYQALQPTSAVAGVVPTPTVEPSSDAWTRQDSTRSSRASRGAILEEILEDSRSVRSDKGSEKAGIFSDKGSEKGAALAAPVAEEPAEPFDAVRNSKVAAGKAISILQKIENHGHCAVETSSVYGAAIALPQIARSCDWPGSLIGLMIRAYFYLLINILLQAFLLSMIGEEQLIMYPFAGRLHLCDFGADIKHCPDAPNCIGPGGTTYTPARLYDYDIWNTRMFVRDSLKALFPHRADEIHAAADIGEYGLENYWCRSACIFIFMLAVIEDLFSTLNMVETLLHIPSEPETWIKYEEPDWAHDKEKAKAVHGWSELDLVSFQVAGMSIPWKILNFIIVLVPKLLLWLALVASGVHYLMETAGIMDVVVNAMALTFVLDVDEMVFERLMNTTVKHILGQLNDMPRFDTSREENELDQEVVDRYEAEELGKGRWRKITLLIPKKLVIVVIMQAFFMWTYYARNCDRQEDGSYISKEMHLPEDISYQPLSLMFGLAPTEVKEPFWPYPE
mmetsp:Transcript_70509/g.181708  ORF Transcript_70509/g.181708 Transcript_70509/m.181708 type:complete len:546 (+) Transcript_70509:141-1778(+)